MLFLTKITNLPLRDALEGAKEQLSVGCSIGLPNISSIQSVPKYSYLK